MEVEPAARSAYNFRNALLGWARRRCNVHPRPWRRIEIFYEIGLEAGDVRTHRPAFAERAL